MSLSQESAGMLEEIFTYEEIERVIEGTGISGCFFEATVVFFHHDLCKNFIFLKDKIKLNKQKFNSILNRLSIEG